MISCEKDGPYIGFSHCPVCSAKYATEMGQTIRKLETALAAMTAERDARDVAIGVLGQAIANVKSTTDWPELTNTMQAGLFCGVEDRDLRDRYDGARYGYEDALERCEEFIRNAVSAVDANPIARAAVEGER